ncbi:asparagine synthase-related protein [Sphingomonas sp. URHD0057]|uniref:asparagine synthase-related protein n=1 Tax=Sphingomonas sp. URHD0057 TaxID=1380389 RepID=UPI000A754210|nr:asparagine synthase-related protein [Sphingomonas sp. URHD0057]
MQLAYRPLRGAAAQARAWRPAQLANGQLVLFHGYFDNAAAIAHELSVLGHDMATLYGLAVDRWGNEADLRIVGDYCTIIADPGRSRLRLARSPLRAPPLYYFHSDELTAAASVPRALFAAGVEQKLNEAHVADSAMYNFTDEEASWYRDIAQVPVGSVVELERGHARRLRKYYNLVDLPFHNNIADEDAIVRAGELLDEGVRACLAGFGNPGSTVSGGLDSPQVAVRAAKALPPGQRLPTFTFHPEPGFDRRVPRWMMGDERPFVKSLAAMHPELDPHFTANDGIDPSHRWQELFHLIGGAPAPMATMYVYHGILSEAQKAGCDVVLLAEWGNLTFSDKGECGYVEYLLKGQWRQWWLALTRPSIHEGHILRRITARSLSALLPHALWRPLRRISLGRKKLGIELMQTLSKAYRKSSGAERRLRQSGLIVDRYQPRSRRHSRQFLAQNDAWTAEVYQGFEQMYGIALRDPTAYRPFVEFCLGLPTRMFMRDGEIRWLAKQMAKDIMPEAQRTNPLFGWWDADWHLRIGRRRQDFLEEFDRLENDERFGKMFDIPRLRAALEDWPEQTETDPQKAFAPQLAVPAALLTARFVQYVEGRNAP